MSPPAANTAEAQLGRLLWLIPRAVRPGGVALDEAAGELEVSVSQLRRDVDALTERIYYHPGGTAEGLSIELTDRLVIRTTGQFGRPPRLTPRELLCVTMGLRMQAGDHAALVDRLEKKLAFPAPQTGDEGAFHLPELEEAWGADEILDVLREGWRGRQPCAFGYLKPRAESPEVRRIHCYGLVHAEGRWYACGADPEAGGDGADALRNFRLDRMVAARLEGEPGAYEIPADFDPTSVLDGGRVLDAAGKSRAAALIRYAPAVGPWVRERWPGEADDGGGYRVRHPLADPGWLIRHVLEYGDAAEVVEPAELRAAVRAAAERMAEGR